MNTPLLTHATLIALLSALLALPCTASPQESPTADESASTTHESMLQEAERARMQAEEARREAEIAAGKAREAARQYAERARADAEKQRTAASEQQTRERALQQEEMERVREELGRAHRELREATREIARAHRDLARASADRALVRQINLGDRAVLGVILGSESPQGVEVIGVSPDGPAERAGLQAGDLLISVGGESLAAGDPDNAKGRDTLFRVMDEVKPGETVAVVVDRGGKNLNMDIVAEQREPSSWQTIIRIPDAPTAPAADGMPAAPDAPQVVVERIEIPDIDEKALHARIRALNDELESRQYLFVSPDDEDYEIEHELVLPDGFDTEVAGFSELAERALREANVWFGLPHAQGLELVQVNEGLGAYFKTDRGVLVVRARENNAYELLSGDVILEIDAKPVNSPTDMMRVLREIEPGSEIEIAIKRDRRNKTLKVVMPENRLGYSGLATPQIALHP